VSFWNQLNYEGIDCYVPLSSASNPTLQQLINGWLEPATASTNPGAYAIIGNEAPIQYFENLTAQSGKPLIFTELGYANDTGAAADPSASGNSPDPTLQANLYQAFFDAWQQSGSSDLIGTYFWEWDPNGSTSNVGQGIDSFSPQNSPAQTVATAGFETQSGTSAIANSASSAGITIDSVVDVSTLALNGDAIALAGGTIEGSAGGETLNNAGSTIFGTGTIGDGSGDLVLDNAIGTIEANGGTLVINTGNPVINAGALGVAAGAAMRIDDNEIDNTGSIFVEGTLAVAISILTLNGAGAVMLAGGTIEGSAAGETLYNADNTIFGTGMIGDGSGNLALDNAGGMIEASGGMLVIDTGTSITNTGTLAAANGAYLQIDDHISGASGSLAIGTGATVELAGADSQSITFDGPTGTLILDQSSTFSGQIIGLTGNGNPSSSDLIDLKDISFGSGTTDSYSGNIDGGILTVSDAQHDSASISLAGDYENSTFSLSSDGDGGTLVVDPPKDSSGVAAIQPASLPTGGTGNDNFVFKPGFDSNSGHAPSASAVEAYASSAFSNQLHTASNQAQMGALSLFHAADGSPDASFNFAHHDSAAEANVLVPDPHVNSAIAHPPIIG
jgi:hypothetical protein